MASLNRRDTDAELIAAFQRGDRSAALAGLYQHHKDQVYSIAFYFFRGDAALAADITQQVFLKLMTDIGKFRGASEFSTWLYRMVVNTCIDASRKHKREVVPIREIAASPDTKAKTPAAQWESKQLDENVRAAVDALPEPFRLAVLLRHFEELSYEEMAGALDCSIGTVSSRLSRAHKLLAESLAPVRAWFEAKE